MPISRFSQNVVCINWDERSLRIVDAVLGRSEVRVRSAVHEPISADVNVSDASALGAFIRRVLGEHRIRTRRAIMDIPRQDTVLNMLKLPSGSRDEMAAMVHMQVGKELPFSKDEAIIDFASVDIEGDAQCEVWVSAVRNPVIEHYRKVAAAAGLRLERIGLRPYANLAAVTASGETAGRILLVDVGPSMTEITVARDGRLAFSRAASVTIPEEGLSGGAGRLDEDASGEASERIYTINDLAPGAGALEALQVEVSRTIAAYRAADPGAQIDRIVVAGNAAPGADVLQAFERRFGAPTRLFEAPASLRWKARPGEAAPLSAVIGLALSHAGDVLTHFNFLHPKEPEAERRERVRRRPLIAAVIALFVLAAGGVAYRPYLERNREIARLDDRIAELKEDDKERDSFLKEHQEIARWKKQAGVTVLDEMQRLAEAFPSNEKAFITRFIFRERGEVDFDLAVGDAGIGTDLAARIMQIQEEEKQPYVARITGSPRADVRGDPRYPFEDTVKVTIRALAPEPRSPRR